MEPRSVTNLVKRLRDAGYELAKEPRGYLIFGPGHEGTQSNPGVTLRWNDEGVSVNGDLVAPSALARRVFAALRNR